MSNQDTQLHTAAQIRAIEAQAMQSVVAGGMGLDGYTLMQRAGQRAFEVLLQRWPDTPGVTVICGKGNNAGDGYVVARLALQFGLRVQVLAVADPTQLAGDAALAYQAFVESGGQTDASDQPIRHTVIVDGLLGTGFKLPLRAHYHAMVERMNQSTGAVLALDIPSGVEADTGAATVVDGKLLAVRADVTVSFVGRKIGLHTGAGAGFVGEQHLVDLGISDEFLAAPASATLLRWQPQQLPELPIDSFKHRRGRVLIIGGDHGMGGAAIMAAEAAMRSGAGLVTVVTQPEHQPALLARLPEAMFMSADSVALGEAISAADFVVIGPGLGRGEWGNNLFAQTATRTAPMLVDADGLYWLKNSDHQPAARSLFITPHAGEAASLLSTSTALIEADRIQAANSLVTTYKCHALLKGPGSVVIAGTNVHICAHGGPAMATAGMGDVLSGICAGLLAPLSATGRLEQVAGAFAQAVALHSASADLAAEEGSPRSVIATDVIERIPRLLAGEETFVTNC
ncbi:MAG: NAD(P)H-hydrate dehydratase [Pseudomonadota bacterium]|nr:NAD(P)H-hydrate dehydratase [Pseudomonadota bacterium]